VGGEGCFSFEGFGSWEESGSGLNAEVSRRDTCKISAGIRGSRPSVKWRGRGRTRGACRGVGAGWRGSVRYWGGRCLDRSSEVCERPEASRRDTRAAGGARGGAGDEPRRPGTVRGRPGGVGRVRRPEAGRTSGSHPGMIGWDHLYPESGLSTALDKGDWPDAGE